MVKWVIFFVVSSLISFFGALSIKLGVFKSVRLKEPQELQFYLLYKEHIGAYHKIAPVIQSVEDLAKVIGLPCPVTFGEYLDDPSQVDEDRLKSIGGCALSAPLDKIPDQLKYKTEKDLYLSAEFEGSPAISPYKVYPKMFEWLEKHEAKLVGPILETYQLKNKDTWITRYYFPMEYQRK